MNDLLEPSEPRLAVFLDFENLALGARDELSSPFDYRPIADAMAERGRVVARFAYGEWTAFADARHELTAHQITLIEIPQKRGLGRKNAADIQMAVDALQFAYERPHVTTFVIVTGDSDFTPLVQKLRELDRAVIGVGIRSSTSALLPPACDEFLYYDDLPGVGEEVPAVETLDQLVVGTLAGLRRSQSGPVRASDLKRAILRKEPAFSESDHGFRGFAELLRHLAAQGSITLGGDADRPGNPVVDLADSGPGAQHAFDLLRDVVGEQSSRGPAALSGLKTAMHQRDPQFSEKALGYGSFLSFCKGAAANGLVTIEWDDQAKDYLLAVT